LIFLAQQNIFQFSYCQNLFPYQLFVLSRTVTFSVANDERKTIYSLRLFTIMKIEHFGVTSTLEITTQEVFLTIGVI